MTKTEAPTPPGGPPARAALNDLARLAAEAAAAGRAAFDASFFTPGPLPGRRPAERVIGVYQ